MQQNIQIQKTNASPSLPPFSESTENVDYSTCPWTKVKGNLIVQSY